MSETAARLPQDLERLIDDGIAGVRAALARYRDPASTSKRRKAQRAPTREAQSVVPNLERRRFEVIPGGKR